MWATWCGPCLEAMKKAKGLKNEMKDKNIVFVYITDKSSNLERWVEVINEIGGEHYYLKNEDEWNYILDSFDIKEIPAYFVYDTTGKLKRKQIGFPGTEKLRTWIEELLQPKLQM
jgi:thiol-disulfide isomerase/thioredoxin